MNKPERVTWKPGNMLYPCPVVMVSCGEEEHKPNIITVAWTGTVCSDPAMVSISVRPDRFSHSVIKESGEFVINLVTEKMAAACDFCGVKSGKNIDKFKETGLTPSSSSVVSAPSISESPVSIECRVKTIINLGSHDLFLAEVAAVTVKSSLIDENGRLRLEDAGLIVYSHGQYFTLGEYVGKFGFSVKKQKT